MTNSSYLHSAAELGQWARRVRKARGLTLQAMSNRAGIGIRFLSEFERGKETAELGKALAALNALGLKLMPVADGCHSTDSGGGISLAAVVPPPTVSSAGPGAAPPATPIPDRGTRPAAGGDAARLWDILVAAGDAQEILSACADEAALQQSTVLKRALERCFDLIGEAARRVTANSQVGLARVPWRAMITRRNDLVMNYEQVDHAALFRAASAELPELVSELQVALAAVMAPGKNHHH